MSTLHNKSLRNILLINARMALSSSSSLRIANRPQVYRRSVDSITQTKLSTTITYLFSPLLGKAPRKQLATKAARKTAVVSMPSHPKILGSAPQLPVTRTDAPLIFRTPLVVSRSPTGSVPVPSLFVRSGRNFLPRCDSGQGSPTILFQSLPKVHRALDPQAALPTSCS